MAEERSTEVLDDLRQKRLAYFQSQTAQSQENTLNNAHNEDSQKSVSISEESKQHDDSRKLSSSTRNSSEVLNHDLVQHSTSAGFHKAPNQSDLRPSPVHTSGFSSDVDHVTYSKTSLSIQHVSTSSLYNHKGDKGHASNGTHGNVSTSFANSKPFHEEKRGHDNVYNDKCPELTRVTPGGETDGYNETVERLIRATKEELLGNKSSDDIWQRIRKISESEIPVKTDENENHSFGVNNLSTNHQTSLNIYEKEGFEREKEKYENGFTGEIASTDKWDHVSRMNNRENDETGYEKTSFSVSQIPRENAKIQYENDKDIKHIPAKSTGVFEPSFTKQNDKFETNRQSYDSATVEAIFSSRQAPWSVTPSTHMDLHESKDLEVISEKKVEESLNLSDLGLSTHRPDTDTESVQAADLNLADSITVELRTVLGEEKFQEFLTKAKRDIDDLHETRSDRSVRKDKTPRLVKESPPTPKHAQFLNNGQTTFKESGDKKQKTSLKDDKKSRSFVRQSSEPNCSSKITDSSRRQATRQISSADPRERQGSLSNRSTDFTPRTPVGETVSNIIGEYVLDTKDKSESNTSSRPEIIGELHKQKASKESPRVVPELNLSEITKTDSPRPKLNRPKHEPYNIYQDKTKSQDAKRSDREYIKPDPAANYEQIPVAKNVVFSADEIYSQAYGSMYHSHPEFQMMSPHSFHGSVQYSIQSSGPVPVSGPAFTIPLTPTTPVFSTTKVTQSLMAGPIQSDTTGNLQHYNSFTAKHQVHPMDNMQIPHPPNQALQQPSLQQSFISGYGNVFDNTQDLRGNTIGMGIPIATNLPIHEHVSHIPHPPSMAENLRSSQQIMDPGFQPRHPMGYSSHPQPMMTSHPPQGQTHKWEEHSGKRDGHAHKREEQINKWEGHTHKREEPVLIPPTTPTSNVEVQTDDMNELEKVTIVEESAFTSVSQIPESDVKIPHPPPTKKGSRPSPRKPIKGHDPNRHIDGIRQHHEQRRQEQEDSKLTDEEILARQRRFAKASLDRYFTSLENLYITPKSNAVKEAPDMPDDIINEDDDENNESEFLGDVNENSEAFNMVKENKEPAIHTCSSGMVKDEIDQSWTEGYNEGYRRAQMNQTDVRKSVDDVNRSLDDVTKSADGVRKSVDDETKVNSEVTGFTVNAGGVTERLESMGVIVSHSEDLIKHSGRNVDGGHTKKQPKQGKKLLICPECEGLNKEYMSWCTHCGEMIIGVEPKLVSKTRDGKLRIKPVTENTDQMVNKLNTINNNTQSIEVNYIQEIADKPFSLNLEGLKSEERDVLGDMKNTSPIKSDGKDSGRPSSDDRDNEPQGNVIEVGNVAAEIDPVAHMPHVVVAETDPIGQVPHRTGSERINPHAIQENLHNNSNKFVDNISNLDGKGRNFSFQEAEVTSLSIENEAMLKEEHLLVKMNRQDSNKGQYSVGTLRDKRDTDTMTVAERAKSNSQDSNKGQYSVGTLGDEGDADTMTVAERVKSIESVKEVELKGRIDTSAQFKNTPMLKGDLAMDSIGASYLIMSKKHDIIKASLDVNEAGDNKDAERRNDKKLSTDKEGLTSVFELTADRSNSQGSSDIRGQPVLPKQTAQTSIGNNAMDRVVKHNRHTDNSGDDIDNISKTTYTQSVHDDVKLQLNRHSVSTENIQSKPTFEHNDTQFQELPTAVNNEVNQSNYFTNESIDVHEEDNMVPPPLPHFSSHAPALHNELSLKLPANSMDLSYDYSQTGSMNYEALDEFKTEEEMKAIKEEKKKERRRKRGHGAIDVEVFGIEEMRESRNSSRGQKLVPILNLAGNSSDEDDDFSTQSDTKSEVKSDVYEKPGPINPKVSTSVSAWERDLIPEEQPHFESDQYPDLEESSRSPDTSARPLSDVLSASIVQEPPREPRRPHVVSESNEDWKVLFDPQQMEDMEQAVPEDHEDTSPMDVNQPFLEHILEQDPQPVKSKTRPKSSKTKPIQSKVRQSLDESNYQRKWARSSTAWSSYNTGELNTSSSLRSSAAFTRPSSAPKVRNPSNPVSRNQENRSSTEFSRPSSAPKGRNLGNLLPRNQDTKLRGVSPSRQPAVRPKRPLSADINNRLSRSTSDLVKSLQASASSQSGIYNSRDTSPYRQGSRSGHHHSNSVSRNQDSLDIPADILGPDNGDDDDIDDMDETRDHTDRDGSPQRFGGGIEHGQAVNESGDASAIGTSQFRLNLGKGKRPASATKSKGKQLKHKKKGGNHGNDLDPSVDLVTVEHRLPKPGIMEWLSDFISATSPKSTYDKYLEMTPRIEAGTMSKWQCLPDEILLHVFAYLDQTSLTTCAQVCHQFYRVAMDESLWKYITIKKRNDLDDLCLGEISKRHPVSLALIQCQGEQVTSKGLRDLFRECSTTLKELNISLCSKGALQGDSLLLHAAARCNQLTHIDTSWCSVTDSGLMAISNTVDRLESLCINGCQAISDDGLETIIKKHGVNLRVLEMFGCFNVSPRGLRCISNNCINLLSLNLGNCYKLTDSCIAQLSTSLGRVETLDLRGCKQIKDNSIRRVVKNCPRLKSLSLANCPNITDVSLLEISTYLTDIRSIDLCGCKKVTDSSIRALVNTCTSLQEIDISSTGCTHRSVSMIANFCGQRLETLKINFLSDVTEQSLIKLAKHCKRLKSVHMYGCPSVRNMSKIREERPTFTINM